MKQRTSIPSHASGNVKMKSATLIAMMQCMFVHSMICSSSQIIGENYARYKCLRIVEVEAGGLTDVRTDVSIRIVDFSAA